MAENVVDLITQQLTASEERGFKPCQTIHQPISGGHFHNLNDFIEKKALEAPQYQLTEEEGKILARKYGSNVNHLFEYAQHANSSLPPFVYAQLLYSIEHEMVLKPVDFFIRRTGSLYFNINWVRKWKDQVIEKMTEIMQWDLEEAAGMKEDLEKELHYAVSPKN